MGFLRTALDRPRNESIQAPLLKAILAAAAGMLLCMACAEAGTGNLPGPVNPPPALASEVKPSVTAEGPGKVTRQPISDTPTLWPGPRASATQRPPTSTESAATATAGPAAPAARPSAAPASTGSPGTAASQPAAEATTAPANGPSPAASQPAAEATTTAIPGPSPAASQTSSEVASTATAGPDTAQAFTIKSFTESVALMQKARLTIQTTPKADCSLAYLTPKGGESKAAGLGKKTADSNGLCSWSWTIGSKTEPGMGRLRVTVNGQTVELKIKIVKPS